MTYKPGQKRGAAGTDLGGQFIGAKSVARALIKMMTPHEAETHDAGVKARTPQGGPAIGRLMARPSVASARMTPATRDAIAADHKASFGPSPTPRGDALAAAHAHVADMQTKAAHQGSIKSLTVAEFDDLDSLDIGQQHAYEDFRTQGMGHEEALRRAQQGPSKAAPRKAGGAPPRPEPLSHDPEVRAVQVENRVRAAYASVLSRSSNSDNRWVGLADLRNDLGEGVNRHEVDDALRKMIHTDGVNVVPESNQKTLTTADRESAVVIGDQNKHLLTIADPSPRPLPSAHAAGGTPSAPVKKAASPRKLTSTDLQYKGEEEIQRLYDEGRVSAPVAAKALRNHAGVVRGYASISAMGSTMGSAVAPENGGSSPEVVAKIKRINDQADAIERVADQIEATPAKPTAAAKMTKAKAAKPPVTPDMLRNAQSPDDIAPLLEGRTAADLRQIAADAGIHVGSKATKDQLKQTILQHGVQRRLNSHAVTGPGVGPAAPKVAAPSAPVKTAAAKMTKQLEPGDRVVWTDGADGTQMHGTVSRDGRVTYVDWEGGRRERVNARGKDSSIRKVGDTAAPTPAKKATAAQKMTRGKAAGVSPAETVAKLSAATSREEARSILAGMTVAQLKAISPSTAGLKKADLIDAIIERTVGNRLNSAAIRQL